MRPPSPAVACLYYPYVEDAKGAGRGLIAALGQDACLPSSPTGIPPSFFRGCSKPPPRQVPVRLEAVDSNGIIPVAEHGRAFPTARGIVPSCSGC